MVGWTFPLPLCARREKYETKPTGVGEPVYKGIYTRGEKGTK